VRTDGRNLRQIQRIEGFAAGVIWSADGKAVYSSGVVKGENKASVWKADEDGSHLEKYLDDGCLVMEPDAEGKNLPGLVYQGDDVGLYRIPLQEKKRIPLVIREGIFTAHYSRDGKAVIYPVASSGEVSFS